MLSNFQQVVEVAKVSSISLVGFERVADDPGIGSPGRSRGIDYESGQREITAELIRLRDLGAVITLIPCSDYIM